MATQEFTSSKFTVAIVTASMAMSIVLIATIFFPNPFLDLAQKFSPSQKPITSLTTTTTRFSDSHESSSCISRYQKTSYYKTPSPNPSPYLLSKLRNYELLHKRCERYSESFNKSFQQLTSNRNRSSAESDCNYVVFTLHFNGLGNRMLGLSSTFLYALLTNRVLLVDFGPDMADLFCEPVKNSTWLLPVNFPYRDQFYSEEFREAHSLGSLLRNNTNFRQLAPPPSILHLFLSYDSNLYEKFFYMDSNQECLQKVPWLILRSDQYFVPYLFLMPMFRPELEKMFPDDKDTVFHHLGNYLFNPSNQAWGLITRFYDAYMANSEQRIGLQVRVFNTTKNPIPLVTKRILQCTQKEKILPQLQDAQDDSSVRNNKTSNKAVLIGSLYREFYEELKNMFLARPTVDGQVIGVHQASHEGSQQSENKSHNMKAWVDIYLLSLSDVLVTSPWSTFGYVAQSLGGLTPWMLNNDGGKEKLPEPACRRGISMEPCFHYPPSYDYQSQTVLDDQEGRSVPMFHCEEYNL
ncbi:Galactoside 2-alpha-L-fucosyltransferase [Linum grandiflorum]